MASASDGYPLPAKKRHCPCSHCTPATGYVRIIQPIEIAPIKLRHHEEYVPSTLESIVNSVRNSSIVPITHNMREHVDYEILPENKFTLPFTGKIMGFLQYMYSGSQDRQK